METSTYVRSETYPAVTFDKNGSGKAKIGKRRIPTKDYLNKSV